MKFMTFAMYDVAKAAEVAQVSDKVAKTPGQKRLAQYVCLGKPFDGVPPNTLTAITIREAESAEALAAVQYPLVLAGVTIWSVPVLEFPVDGAVAEVKKYTK